MPTVEEELTHAGSGAVIFDRLDRMLIRVQGPDARRYLQGRITQDIKGLQAGQGAKSLLLTPQGKIQGQMIVLAEANDFLLLAEAATKEEPEGSFLKALLQFKVADMLEAISLSASHSVLMLQGACSEETLKVAGFSTPPHSAYFHSAGQIAGVLVQAVCNPVGSMPAYELIFPTYAKERITEELIAAGKEFPVVCGSEETRNVLRIMAKLPEGGRDLDEKTVATEIDTANLVSFKKGCYAGQEVVEMSIARGRPNRRLVALTGAASQAPAVGSPLCEAPGSDKTCGTITSSCLLEHQQKAYCLAFVKTAVAEDQSLYAETLELRQM